MIIRFVDFVTSRALALLDSARSFAIHSVSVSVSRRMVARYYCLFYILGDIFRNDDDDDDGDWYRGAQPSFTRSLSRLLRPHHLPPRILAACLMKCTMNSMCTFLEMRARARQHAVQSNLSAQRAHTHFCCKIIFGICFSLTGAQIHGIYTMNEMR